MKYLLISCALLCAGVSFSQSKKKQIEQLEHKVDSLEQINSELKSHEARLGNTLKELSLRYKESTEELQIHYKDRELFLKKIKWEIRRADSLQNVLSKLNAPKSKEKVPTEKNNTQSSGFNNNPFGDGGSGNGAGLGSDSGGRGNGTGIGFDNNRKRLNNVSVSGIEIDVQATIYYKLTIDGNGNVIAFSHSGSKTTTTNLQLINRIGVAIKNQVKYNKVPDAPLTYQFYTIHVKPT